MKTVKIFIVGDVMGKPGRNCIKFFLERIRSQFDPDVMVLNGENAAGGFGITPKIYQQFTQQFGFDCVTNGNHWHDKREIIPFLATAERMVIPANMNNVSDESLGCKILRSKSGCEFAVLNVIGKVFMNPDNRCPFKTIDRLLDRIPSQVRVRLVDMHGEASSEKQGMGRYLDGRVSMVYGTHSHVPTGDERIFPLGTGFVTDIGMTGGYDSVIGIKRESALKRLISGEKKDFEPASADPWLCAIFAEIDSDGRCQRVERIRWEQRKFDHGLSQNDRRPEVL